MSQALKKTISKKKSNKSIPTVEAEILHEKTMVCTLKNTSMIQFILIWTFILFHKENEQTSDKVLGEIISVNNEAKGTKTTMKIKTNRNKKIEKKNAKFLVNIIFLCLKKVTS